MVNGSLARIDGVLEAVWGVLPEAVIAVEHYPIRPQLEVHGRFARIWAAVTNNPIWAWKPVLGTMRLIILYDEEVSGTRYGDAADVIRQRLGQVRSAGIRIEVEYHQIHRPSA